MTAAFSSRRTLIPLALGFLLLAASMVCAAWLSTRQERAVGWVRHTLEVENRLNLIQLLVTNAETGQRGYLLAGEAQYLDPYSDAVGRLPSELDALEQATTDNPTQRAALAALRPAVRAKMEELAGAVGLMRIGRSADALAVMRSGRGRALMERIRAITSDMAREEDRLLAERSENAATATVIARAILFGSGALVVLLAIYATRDGHRRIVALEEANRQLAAEVIERSAAQGQVRQLQKMEAVGKLTGGIAHDFNNMLAVVMGSLDIARRRLTGNEHPGIAACINNAQEGAARAATLTARLLAFSRQQPLEPKVADANKLVVGMSEMLRRTLGEQISVETVLAGGLWKIRADVTQIESALLNLSVNARDAMPGGGKLTIETANCELDDRYARAHDEVRAGQYVMISVTDTGTGMTREVVERAFEPFYTTKGVGQGTGLGLSQVFGFVKQSNGHLKVYSEVGHGTTVKVYLPRYTGKEAEEAAVASQQSLPHASGDEIILVVEDEAQVRHMSVDALRELGYTVVPAGDAAQAIEQFAIQPRIDLLFTDIVMPGMTGRALADELRKTRPDLKILYTTGYTRNAIVHGGMVDPDVSFLPKPFTIEALARKVREVLDAD